MKKPISSKVLILSLSALVLVGSGCERRGRAPVKADESTPTQIAPTTGVDAPTVSEDQKTVADTAGKKIDLESSDIGLERDAQLNCEAPAIDVNAKADANSFVTDLTAINAFQKCMRAGGLNLQLDESTGTRIWKLMVSSNVEKGEFSPAYLEFARLSSLQNSSDDAALKVMLSRLELSVRRLSSMGQKYSDDRLRSSGVSSTDSIQYGESSITIGATLLDLQKGVDALNAGRAEISALRSISDGTEEAKTEAEMKIDAEAIMK